MKVLVVFSLVVLAVVAIEFSKKDETVDKCLVAHKSDVQAINDKYIPLLQQAETEEEKCNLFAQGIAEIKQISVGICNMDKETWNLVLQGNYAHFNAVSGLNCKPVEAFKFGKKLPLFSTESIKLFGF